MKFKKNRNNEVVVIGIGKLGIEIIRSLYRMNKYYIIAIDSVEANVEEVREYADTLIIGNVTEEDFLDEIGIENAEFFIVAIGDDVKSSILVSSLLKDKFDGKVIVRSEERIHRKILKKLGISTIINPHFDSAAKIVMELSITGISMSMEDFEINAVDDNISWTKISLPKKYEGKIVKDLDLPKGILLMTYKRDGVSKVPRGETKLEKGDDIHIIGENKNLMKWIQNIEE